MKFKNHYVAFSLIATLMLPNHLNASGIPVIDAASIAQAVQGFIQDQTANAKDYAMQLQQFQQMLKDTLNFEKQMESLGVDMKAITEVLGETQDMINDFENLYENIVELPDNIWGETSNIANACRYLEINSSKYSNKITQIKNFIKRDINQCITSVKNADDIFEDVEKLEKEALDLLEKDYAGYQEKMRQAVMLKQTIQFIKEKDTANNANEMIKIVDDYYSGKGQNSQKKFQKDMKALTAKVKNAQTTKEREALTNTILLKLTTQLQDMNETNMKYYRVIMAEKESQISAKDAHEMQKPKILTLEEINPTLGDYLQKQPQYDKNGIPILQLK